MFSSLNCKIGAHVFSTPKYSSLKMKNKEFNKNTNTNRRVANMKKCALLQITDSFVGFVVQKNNDWKMNFVIWKSNLQCEELQELHFLWIFAHSTVVGYVCKAGRSFLSDAIL